ncbi:MAG: hypothetical protein KKF44_00840 [Nanoarchaeota archaeon]|nr:hypothetical protein [Nanoarchaeota archaeon]
MAFIKATLEGLVASVGSLDPGYLINQLEYQLGGVSIPESTPTAGQNIINSAYERRDNLGFGDYLGRYLGYAVGAGGTGFALQLGFGALALVNPLLAVGAYVGTGLGLLGYGLYKRATTKSEKSGSFFDGVKYGFQKAVDPISSAIHDMDYVLSGKAPYESGWHSDINSASGSSGRNLSSMLGGLTGIAAGAGALGATVVGGFMLAGPIGAIAAPALITGYKFMKSLYKTITK